MRRIPLFEIEDQPWCPAPVRQGGTRYLHLVGNLLAAPYRPFARALAEALQQTGERQLLDLCSGSAGPLPTLLDLLDEDGVPVTAWLSDKYPDVDAFTERWLADPVRIRFHRDPVDATAVGPEHTGFRLLCSALHHFAPDHAAAILTDAVDKGHGIAVLEVVERRPASILMAALGLLGVPLLFPWVRPFRWDLAALVYLLPLIPLMTAFDGVVSALRTYSVTELHDLARAADPDERFAWRVERSSVAGLIGFTWMIGVPR